MKKIKLLFIIALLISTSSCEIHKNKNYETSSHKDTNGFTYETVENDPTGLRLYTLENGLKVYLAKNEEHLK
jgi:zinc protease